MARYVGVSVAVAVAAAGALVMSYKRWTYNEDIAWLAAQRVALFEVPDAMPRGRSKHGGARPRATLFLLYRKTGIEASVRLCYALHDTACPGFQGAFRGPWFQNDSNVRLARPGRSSSSRGVILSPAWERPLSPAMLAASRYAFVIVPSRSWPLPKHVRVVHWVREPLSLILSGYRYAKSQSLEPWQAWRSHCWSCDEDAHRAAFRACGYQCSYNDLLHYLDEANGALLEAILDRAMLQNMLSNVQRWANHPNVLHLSVSHLRADYVLSIKCMLRFLGLAGDHITQRLESLDHDPHLFCQANGTEFQDLCDWILRNAHTRNDRHTTYGRYNNSALRRLLAEHPVWAEQFDAARQALSAVFRRQQALYGCPSGVT
uniref:Sulfotransferase domain-containing protein n=1 Tax=Alexandrium catenella TaxID=2925 RepID=A0A7S1QBH9_ALECA